MFNMCIDALKRPSYYPQNITVSNMILELLKYVMEERKLGAKPGTAPDWKVLGQGLDFSP